MKVVLFTRIPQRNCLIQCNCSLSVNEFEDIGFTLKNCSAYRDRIIKKIVWWNDCPAVRWFNPAGLFKFENKFFLRPIIPCLHELSYVIIVKVICRDLVFSKGKGDPV